jgi:hypothetical protein
VARADYLFRDIYIGNLFVRHSDTDAFARDAFLRDTIFVDAAFVNTALANIALALARFLNVLF